MLELFNQYVHIYGACGIRIKKIFCKISKKPDISIIDNFISIGGSTTIEGLSKNGITSIVDLRNEDMDNPIEIQTYSMDYLRVGLMDGGTPSEIQTKEIFVWINEKINRGNKIFVHCNLGRGRAAIIASIYLISKGMTYYDAISFVKKRRRYVYLNKKQLNFLKEFRIE